MKIAVVGRGNVGGGLGDRWEGAGHEVTRIGKDGGDVSDAEAVLVAVPGAAVADAFDAVSGWDGVGDADTKPSNIWSGDEEARDVVEQLIRDAGYDAFYAGPLENASAQEKAIRLFFGMAQSNGQFLYRFAKPDEL